MSEVDPLARLTALAAEWIRTEREQHVPFAVPLPPDLRLPLEPFFEARILDLARFRVVPVIADPPFLDAVRVLGLPIDFTQMSGITFQDTVLLNQVHPIPLAALMFHELVHVAQYDILGIDEFARRYVGGLAENGFDYYKVPLELDAYNLQQRFEANPEAGYSVRDDLANRLKSRRT